MAKSQWLMATLLAATNAKANTPLFPFLARLMRGEGLTAPEAAKFFHAMTDPSTGLNQIAAARLAERSIDSGQAQNKLDRLVQISTKN